MVGRRRPTQEGSCRLIATANALPDGITLATAYRWWARQSMIPALKKAGAVETSAAEVAVRTERPSSAAEFKRLGAHG